MPHALAEYLFRLRKPHAAGRLSHLVYLDAFVPADGQSLFDVLRPERREMYQQQAQTQGAGGGVDGL